MLRGLWGCHLALLLACLAAADLGIDATDYGRSYTARSFVPYYAQRLSSACVLSGAGAIQKSMKRMADRRSSATTAA